MALLSKSLLEFILKTYGGNPEEFIDTVEEVVMVNKEIQESNTLPGIICIIGGPILGLVLGVTEVAPWLISLVVGLVTTIIGFVLKAKLTKTVTKQVPEKKIRQVQRVKTRKLKIVRAGRLNLRFSIQNLKNINVITGHYCSTRDHVTIPFAQDFDKLCKEFNLLRKELEKIPDIMYGEQTLNKFNNITIYGDYVPLRGIENRICRYLENLRADLNNICELKVSIKRFTDTQVFKHFSPANGSNHTVNLQSLAMVGFFNIWMSFLPPRIGRLNEIRDKYVKTKLPDLLTSLSLKEPGAFNFYCPVCNRQSVMEYLNRDYSVQNTKQENPKSYSKNTRCAYDPQTNAWICPVCTTYHQIPIPSHRIEDEVFKPVLEKLFQEHKVEREKKISETRLKELDYRKELKQKIDEINFSTYNQILSLEEELEGIKVEITGQKEAIEYLNDLAEKFQHITSTLIRSIQEETSKSVQRIHAEQTKVAELIERQTNRDLEAYGKRMKSLSVAKRLDDEKREAISLATLNSLNNVQNLQKKQFALDVMVTREVLGIDPYKREPNSSKSKLDREIESIPN